MKKNEDIFLITNYDPLSYLLRNKFKVSPLQFAIVIFVADLIVDAFLGFRYGVFTSTSSNPGILQDSTALATDFLANPVIAFVYLWILDGASTLFQNLHNNKVFYDESLFWQKVEETKKLYNAKLLFFATTALATIFTANQVAAYHHWVPWKTLAGYLYIYPEMSFFRLPFWFISIYGLVFALFNVIITFIGLQKIFHAPQALKLYLSHPDQCAGFGSIGKFITNTGFVVAPISFWVSVSVISESQKNNLMDVYPVIVIILVYIIMVPIVFLWPLFSAHQAMVTAKKKMLLDISEKINLANETLLNGASVNKKLWETIEIYQNLYERYLKIAEWPFNLQNVQRFFAVVGSSLIPALGSYFIEFLTTNLIPYIRTIIP